jgi:hypothetical protein
MLRAYIFNAQQRQDVDFFGKIEKENRLVIKQAVVHG